MISLKDIEQKYQDKVSNEEAERERFEKEIRKSYEVYKKKRLKYLKETVKDLPNKIIELNDSFEKVLKDTKGCDIDLCTSDVSYYDCKKNIIVPKYSIDLSYENKEYYDFSSLYYLVRRMVSEYSETDHIFEPIRLILDNKLTQSDLDISKSSYMSFDKFKSNYQNFPDEVETFYKCGRLGFAGMYLYIKYSMEKYGFVIEYYRPKINIFTVDLQRVFNDKDN